MTDSTDSPPTTDAPPDETAPAGKKPRSQEDGLSWEDVRRKLLVGAVLVLGLLATWATYQVYLSLSRAISIWVNDAYVPIFGAAFNVVVVLVAIAGILALVRELS